MRRSSRWNIFMILQNLFTKIAKTPARAAATLVLGTDEVEVDLPAEAFPVPALLFLKLVGAMEREE